MTRFWMVRHGPTHARGMVGWTDLPADLSDEAKLDRLRALLPDAPVISSDLTRAVTTADRLVHPSQRPPRPRLAHDPDLRELHFGAWEMRHFAEIEAESPALIRAFWETPGDVCPPGGESWDQLSQRVGAALDRLAGTAPEVIVVAHFGAILAALQIALNLTAQEVFSHRIDNLSVTRLTLGKPFGAADMINHIP